MVAQSGRRALSDVCVTIFITATDRLLGAIGDIGGLEARGVGVRLDGFSAAHG